MQRTRRKWTDKEKEIIRENYTKIGIVETCKLLPEDRDYNSVKRMGEKLGLKSNVKKRFHLKPF